MTRLLASVTHAAEARLAVAGGADIIDCKDPARGALGALPPPAVADIVRAVGGQRPVSATVGDLPPRIEALGPAIQRVGDTGVDFVKVGLFRARGASRLLGELAILARRYALVGVLFADRNPGLDVIEAMAAAGFAGVMLDTADKGSGALPDHAPRWLLEGLVRRARRSGLACGFAGSLSPRHIDRLLPLEPDYLGFRGGLCEAGRGSPIDRARLAEVRGRIPRLTAPPGVAEARAIMAR
jgi:uncharacterized protein (UPF0264 family)